MKILRCISVLFLFLAIWPALVGGGHDAPSSAGTDHVANGTSSRNDITLNDLWEDTAATRNLSYQFRIYKHKELPSHLYEQLRLYCVDPEQARPEEDRRPAVVFIWIWALGRLINPTILDLTAAVRFRHVGRGDVNVSNAYGGGNMLMVCRNTSLETSGCLRALTDARWHGPQCAKESGDGTVEESFGFSFYI